VRLVSRKGNTYRSFRALCQPLAVHLSVNDAVRDGEIVDCGLHLGPDGKPQLYDLMRRGSPLYSCRGVPVREEVAQALGILRGDTWMEEVGEGLTELKVRRQSTSPPSSTGCR
jgi:hypothetical protein